MIVLSDATQFSPSANDPRIVAVLAARNALDMAFDRHDVDTVTAIVTPDLVVNAPINRVVDAADALARFRARRIDYTSLKVNLEFAGVRGDLVVLMGEEIVTPTSDAPHAGKTVHRRFTDIWRQINGAWKLAIRQGTITSIE